MKQAFNIILLLSIVFIDISLCEPQDQEDGLIKHLMKRHDYEIRNKLPSILNKKAAAYGSQSKWAKSSLTYSIQSYPIQISQQRTKKIFREAFKVWTDHIPLEITEVCSTCRSDLKINFFSRDHSDDAPFDGPGKALSHEFLPGDGRMHYDKDEPWTER